MAYERKLLWQVLLINAAFFLIEIVTGLISNSMGLVADSLDMLADSVVYGLSLYAVGGHADRKKGIARTSGYFQFALALFGFIEVLRRFFAYESTPNYSTMIWVSLFALIGNAICLYLIHKSKNTEPHIMASKIFTANDVLINAGVILAGVLVYLTSSKVPDLVIGALVFLLVIRGAMKIFKTAK